MPAEVHVILYDLLEPLITGLRPLGTGAFHVSVEVHGKEWGYGFVYMGPGIFICDKQVCTGMRYREAVLQGETLLSDNQVTEVLSEFRAEWIGSDYDVLTRNCCTFADLFCRSIGVDPLPQWMANLAAAGATVGGGCLRVLGDAEREAVLSKAKLNEIDQKYTADSGATAKVSQFLQGPRLRLADDPTFWVELGPAYAPSEAIEAAPNRPNATPIWPSEVRKGLCERVDQGPNQAAPTLLGQHGHFEASPVTKEVAESRQPSCENCCGCCQQ